MRKKDERIFICYNHKSMIGYLKAKTLNELRGKVRSYNSLSNIRITQFKDPVTLKKWTVR